MSLPTQVVPNAHSFLRRAVGVCASSLRFETGENFWTLAPGLFPLLWTLLFALLILIIFIRPYYSNF